MKTLRQKFSDKPQYNNPNMAAAILLAIYERGGTANSKDPLFCAKVDAYCEMNDEQFDKEHQRLEFEMRKEPQ